MKKQTEFEGQTALAFCDNLENLVAKMEKLCADLWRIWYVNFTDNSEFFTRALANCPERQEEDRRYHKENATNRIKNELRYYNSLPNWNGQASIDKEDVENLAFRIQLQKAAQRIAARYEIELN